MNPVAYLILFLVLAIGTYLNQLDPDRKPRALIEDRVGSQMAAPERPEIPL
jgi:hypothetical protein